MRDPTPLHSFVCVAIQSRSANVLRLTQYGTIYMAHCNECGLAKVYGPGVDEPANAANMFEGLIPGTFVDMGAYW